MLFGYLLEEEKAIYIVGNDRESRHEDCATMLPGEVSREWMAEIDSMYYTATDLVVAKGDTHTAYPLSDLKSVETARGQFYKTAAFIPEDMRGLMDFETKFCLGASQDRLCGELRVGSYEFCQRTLRITLDGDTATVSGNTSGYDITIGNAHISINTDIPSVRYVISGASDCATLALSGTQTACIATEAGSPARIASITAASDLVFCGDGMLQMVYDAPADAAVNRNHTLIRSDGNVSVESGRLSLFTSAFDGKAIHADGSVTVNGGNVDIITTGEGTLTDATFPTDAELGSHAILAEVIDVNGGRLRVKTFGHNGGVGLAATKRITFSGGEAYLACYDDPIKSGESIAFRGGTILSSSLTNDAVDCKGSISMSGGRLYAYGPKGAEGCFDNNGKTFAVSGGTIIAAAYKGDCPQASKSSQASFRYYKQKGIRQYVRIVDAQGATVLSFETPAHPTTTLVITDPALQKGETYTIMTGETFDGEYVKVADIQAE